MNPFLRGALLLLFFCSSAIAQQDHMERSTGRGLVCDKSEQLRRFVEFRNEGRETDAAIRVINEEAHKPTACGVILAAFSFGKPVAKLTMQGEAISIVEITVVAMSAGSKWIKVPPTIQYTIVSEASEDL